MVNIIKNIINKNIYINSECGTGRGEFVKLSPSSRGAYDLTGRGMSW